MSTEIPFNGQTHPARNRLRRLGFEHHPIENPFWNAERLRHLFSRFPFVSRHKSKGRNLALKALSGFINQPEPFSCPAFLNVSRRHPRSSPGPQVEHRTRPSLSPEVVLHIEHSQWRLCCGVACIIMLPCPCGQKGAFDLDRSLPCGRKHCPIVQRRLWIQCHHGQGNALPPIPAHLASFVVHHSVDRSGWMIAVGG